MKEATVSYRRTTLESLEHVLELLAEKERKPGMKVYPNDNTRAISDLLWLHREIVKWEELDEPEVLSQGLPVIPNYVAKWISEHHERFDLYPALKRLEGNALNWEGVYDWYRKNTRKFVNAYLTGKYEVEEEQKYYVLSKELHPMLCENAGTDKKIMESTTQLTINEKKLYKEQYALTEQEIKDYDERYWPFAVKVEELEE